MLFSFINICNHHICYKIFYNSCLTIFLFHLIFQIQITYKFNNTLNYEGQPDWVNNQTCQDQNTWTNSYKLSADQKQNGGFQKQNGVVQQQNAHTINTFKQTENIYSRIGQPNGDGRYLSIHLFVYFYLSLYISLSI